MQTRNVVLAALSLGLLCTAPSHASAQRRGGYGGGCYSNVDAQNYFVSPYFRGNPLYDGRVTFARIKYQGTYECGGEGPGWSHDYPRTESHFMRILGELTAVRPFIEKGEVFGGAVVRLDEPALMNYPIAYLSEPGGWRMNDAELAGLRSYIKRGGFIIFDDIEGDPNPDYRNLLSEWNRAFPGSRPIKLTNAHNIFNCFFSIDLNKIPSKVGRYAPEYLGIFEDNDPNKRMIAVIDNYADIGEFIEYSDEGFDMVPANEAYKLWVNYFMYALTHSGRDCALWDEQDCSCYSNGIWFGLARRLFRGMIRLNWKRRVLVCGIPPALPPTRIRHACQPIVAPESSVIPAAFALVSCGGGGGDPVSIPITVAVSPGTTTVNAGATQNFSAVVTNASNTAVTWTSTGGTIQGTGASVSWTAPVSGGPFTVTATSVQDVTKSSSATATVTPVAVSIAPNATVTVAAGASQAFVATVANAANTAVTWTSTAGTIAGTGSNVVWTAPVAGGSYTVTATSTLDPTQKATVNVTVTPVAIIVGPASPTIGAGGTQTFTATVTGGADNTVTWTSTGGTLNATGTTAQWTAPVGGGSFQIKATSVLNPAISSTANATVTPIAITLTPGTRTLYRGEPATFTAAVTGASTGLGNVTFTATCGTSTVVALVATYTAPVNGGPCTVTATSVTDPTKSASATVTVRSERLVTVTTDADDGACTFANCSLREAINAANAAPDADVITLSAPAAVASAQPFGLKRESGFSTAAITGTLTLTSALPEITTAVTIVGPGADQLTINADASVANPRRVFTISGTGTATISGLTVRGGRAPSGGGILVQSGGTLNLNNAKVINNQSTGRGAGLHVFGAGTLRLTDVLVQDNEALGTTGDGGGIAAEGATLSVTRGTINTNIANGSFGGGIYTTGSLTSIDQTTITGNRTALTGVTGGGGVAAWIGGTVTITNSALRSNTAPSGVGGGLIVGGDLQPASLVTITITDVVIEDNTSFNQGGGVQITRNGRATVDRLVLKGNKVIGTTAGTPTIAGGMLFGSSVSATMTRSTVIGNSIAGVASGSTDGGGGIALAAENAQIAVTVSNTTISGNTSTLPGGGVYAPLGSLALENVTISGNSAPSGGGLFARATIALRNVTMFGNNTQGAAGAGGGIGTAAGSAISFANVLMANNRANGSPNNCMNNSPGTMSSTGYNLIDDLSCSKVNNVNDKANIASGLNTTLADNGGPTFTHALLVGSAAINGGNAATCLTTDQRGVARSGVCDIGAYEFVPAALVAPTTRSAVPPAADAPVVANKVLKRAPLVGAPIAGLGPVWGAVKN